MTSESQSQNLLLPVLLVFALLFALMVFPPLGALVALLSPFPLVFIFLQRGKQVALVLMSLIFGVLWFLVGQDQALLFMAEYAVMALVLGEMIQARYPGDWCIGASSLVSAVVSIILLVALLGNQETTVQDFFEKQIRAHFIQSIETFESVEQNKAEIAEMKAFVDKTVGGFASAYPAFVFVGSLISAIANYSLLRIVWGRIYSPGLFSEGTFAEWICPENFIWSFILASAAWFLGHGIIADVGLNLFIVVFVIYFAQGTSILVHFLKARKVPIFLWLFLFIIIFAQPLFIGLITGI
ncbi:MAG: DUF2232 domain-containing protein, partial [Nitrospinota bacterium]|nr:DUF2232 domain-containing protein [Nitrospinota bacterium]